MIQLREQVQNSGRLFHYPSVIPQEFLIQLLWHIPRLERLAAAVLPRTEFISIAGASLS
jgi:hypothetical protein